MVQVVAVVCAGSGSPGLGRRVTWHRSLSTSGSGAVQVAPVLSQLSTVSCRTAPVMVVSLTCPTRPALSMPACTRRCNPPRVVVVAVAV